MAIENGCFDKRCSHWFMVQVPALLSNTPLSMYEYSSMALRLLGKTSIFGGVFFVSKSLLGIVRQRKLKTFAILTQEPQIHVRILMY